MSSPRLQIQLIGLCFVTLWSCSCAGPSPAVSRLPPETSFNPNAARGDFLYVKVRMESGEELKLLLDTVFPHTILDKSLEPKLGRQLGWRNTWEPFMGGVLRVKTFQAPGLYL